MNPDTMTLFDRMNGDKILPEAVKKFHTKVMKDTSLAPFFEKLEPDAQIEHQKIFITFAMGVSNKWPGRTLRQMHSKLTLEDQHFESFLNYTIETFVELEVPEHLLEESRKIVEATRREILNKNRF